MMIFDCATLLCCPFLPACYSSPSTCWCCASVTFCHEPSSMLAFWSYMPQCLALALPVCCANNERPKLQPSQAMFDRALPEVQKYLLNGKQVQDFDLLQPLATGKLDSYQEKTATASPTPSKEVTLTTSSSIRHVAIQLFCM